MKEDLYLGGNHDPRLARFSAPLAIPHRVRYNLTPVICFTRGQNANLHVPV
jgi:hypothetical protein